MNNKSVYGDLIYTFLSKHTIQFDMPDRGHLVSVCWEIKGLALDLFLTVGGSQLDDVRHFVDFEAGCGPDGAGRRAEREMERDGERTPTDYRPAFISHP